MKHRILTMTLLLSAITFAAEANPVDMNTAREVALKFVNANTKTHLRGAEELQLVTTYSISRGDAAFHIFNTPNGFVIVSADDCATPILGYSDEGRPFDPDNVPVQLQDYLQGFVEQIEYGIENHIVADENTVRQWELVQAMGRLNDNRDGEAVEPLLTTQWNQDWPFNDKCPVDIDGDRCLVGCVAVALGQIMKYHNWPYKGNGYVHYTLQNIPDTISAVFDTTYYDWEGMPDGWTTSGYESMAQLLADVGKSLFMEYSASSSGAFEDIQTLADVFNYDYFSMQEIKRDHMDDSTWTALIKNEMDNNRPVYYSGYSDPDPTVATGHGFVCDGYDENGMYHFNFGWGGNCDGYFMLSHIYSPFFVNFNYYQSALIGIQPATGNTLSGNETLSGSLAFDESLYCGAFSNITIMPGTELKFAPGKSMCVTGSILANGTEDNPITITALDTTMGWGGMQIHPSMICYKMVQEPDTLSLSHTTISYSSNNGLDIAWPNYFVYPATLDNVVKKGVKLSNVSVHHHNNMGLCGENVLLALDSCEISFNGNWGIYFDICGMDVRNSIINNNHGAIYQRNQTEFINKPSHIENNSIFQNYYGGQDVTIIEAGAEIRGNHIFDNYPYGGEIMAKCVIRGGRIENNIIHDNICDNVMILAGPIIGNKIYNNTGKAIMVFANGSEIYNNLIFNNVEGIYCSYENSPSYVNNNTIVNNDTGINYGEWGNGTIYLNNNIIYNNSVDIDVHNSLLTGHNNIIKGGNNNVQGSNPNNCLFQTSDKNPRFVNPTAFIGYGEMPDSMSFELSIASPAIDNAYVDSTMVLPAFDLDGNPRINRILDIGAYENQSDTIHPCFFSDESLIKSCVGLPLDLYYPYRGENCSFAWYHNDNLIPDANSDTLHIGTITENDEGDFYCVISNVFGIDTSSVIHLSLSPQLPGCIEAIYGSDTIYHFQRNIPFSINNVIDADKIEWVVSEGLSYTKTSDTTILVSVDQAVDSAFLYVVASNGCGACADTAVIHFTVLPLPRQIGLNGDDLLITNCDFEWPCPTVKADPSFYYDNVEWQTPSWITVSSYEIGTLNIRSSSNFDEDTDTIYARWVVNGYETGDWTPYPMRVFHSENYGDIVYVTEQGGGDEDGSLWTNALPDLSDGILVASYLRKKLWVAAGTYYGDSVSESAFTFTWHVELYGGFAGNEDDSFDIKLRNLSENASVLDGQNSQSLIRGQGDSYWYQRSIIDGFVIQHGKGAAADIQNDTIRNCVFRYNNMDNGMASAVNGGVVQNCLFYENTGCPIYGSYVSNATIVNNSGFVEVFTMTNSIVQGSYVWGEVSYSAMDAWDGGGEGNILLAHNNNGSSPDSLYVRFIDPENGDFRLAYGSACINAGTPEISELGLPSVDLQGNPRVIDGRIDMGAYEFSPTYCHFTTPGNWSEPSNWSDNTLPSTDAIVFIDAPCQLDQNASVAALTVSDGQSLTLLSGNTLTVTGTLVNADASGLVIKDGAQIIHSSEGVYATMEKDITGYTDDGGFCLLAVPFTDSVSVPEQMTGGEYDLYLFDQYYPNAEWRNHKSDAFSLVRGQGYLYANSNDTTLTLTGQIPPSDEPFSVNLTYDANAINPGYNLVGNPFTCDAYIDRAYYVLNEDGSGINPVEVSASIPIPPCTSVVVKALDENDTVVFTKATH